MYGIKEYKPKDFIGTILLWTYSHKITAIQKAKELAKRTEYKYTIIELRWRSGDILPSMYRERNLIK